MKFNIACKSLLASLNIVVKGMASRSSLPILEGIYLKAMEDGNLILKSTDLETSIRHTTSADVVEPGEAVVPGKLFINIVKNLPDAAISVSSHHEQTELICAHSSFVLSSLNPADFPYFPSVEPSQTISFPADQLTAEISHVIKAVSRDESRVVLTGIDFYFDGKDLRLTATDTYRLAIAHMAVEGSTQPIEAIIPGLIFQNVARLASKEKSVSIGFAENQIVFNFGSTVLISRKIEGNYPDFTQVIPTEYNVRVQMDTDELRTAIKRVSLLIQEPSQIRMSFSEERQEALISSKTQDVGDAHDIIGAHIEGGDIDIAFNHQYILDGLSVIQGDTILDLQSPLKPGIFKGSENPGYIYVVMPVRLN